MTDALGVTGSLGGAGAGVFSTADLKHTVKAFTDGGGSINAGSIELTSNANDHLTPGNDCANFGACAHATAGAAGIFGAGALTSPKATDSATVRTYLGSGTHADCDRRRQGHQQCSAEGQVGWPVGRAISWYRRDDHDRGGVRRRLDETHVDGTVVQAGSVTVRSTVDYAVRSYSENVAASLLVAGAFASRSLATIGDDPISSTPNVATYVGGSGNITSSGDVIVSSRVTTSAVAKNQAITASFVAGRSANAFAKVQLVIRTYAANGAVVRSINDSVTFLATHNFDETGLNPMTGNKATATAGDYGGGARRSRSTPRSTPRRERTWRR